MTTTKLARYGRRHLAATTTRINAARVEAPDGPIRGALTAATHALTAAAIKGTKAARRAAITEAEAALALSEAAA